MAGTTCLLLLLLSCSLASIPPSSWFSDFLDFVLEDLGDSEEGETPRLDLSNLRHSGDLSTIDGVFQAALQSFEAGFESRVGAREVLLAVYHNSVLTELAPLVLGMEHATSLASLHYQPSHLLARNDPDLKLLLGQKESLTTPCSPPASYPPVLLLPASCAFHRVLEKVVAGDPRWFPSSPDWQTRSPALVSSLRTLHLSSLICTTASSSPPLLLLSSPPLPCSNMPSIDPTIWRKDVTLRGIVTRAQRVTNGLKIIEQELLERSEVAPVRRGGGVKPSTSSLQMAEEAMVLELVTKELVKGHEGGGRSRRAEPLLLPRIDNMVKMRLQEGEECTLEPLAPCSPTARYRSYSGHCNSLTSGSSGAALQPLRRLLPPQYGDQVSSPRARSSRGQPLPNPRQISLALHRGEAPPDQGHTLALMQWGQFIDHDISATPMHRGPQGSLLDCSSCSSGRRHPACFPIPLPRANGVHHDPGCMPFVRSLPGQRALGPRQQLNQVGINNLHNSGFLSLKDS